MDLTANIKARLQGEGFSSIEEYDDTAGEAFSEHDHPGDQRMIVVRGSMIVEIGGAQNALKVGDELDIPARTKHSAIIGPEGCIYIVGEKT